jgi:hypothetical protein
LDQRALFKVCDKHCFANHLFDWFVAFYKTILLLFFMCFFASIFLSLLLALEQRGKCLMSCVHWGWSLLCFLISGAISTYLLDLLTFSITLSWRRRAH